MGSSLTNEIFVVEGTIIKNITNGQQLKIQKDSGNFAVIDGNSDGTISSQNFIEPSGSQKFNFLSHVSSLILAMGSASYQTYLGLNSSPGISNNLLNFINQGNASKNHDHGLQSNPTLFIHSNTNPDTDNTEWMSFTHDQTDGKIRTGSGDIAFEGRYYGYLNIGSGGENSLPNITDDDTFKIAFCNDSSVSETPLVPIICYKRNGTQYWNKLVTDSSKTGIYT
jgi:hypothetical protein